MTAGSRTRPNICLLGLFILRSTPVIEQGNQPAQVRRIELVYPSLLGFKREDVSIGSLITGCGYLESPGSVYCPCNTCRPVFRLDFYRAQERENTTERFCCST